MNRWILIALLCVGTGLWAESPRFSIEGARLFGGDVGLSWGTVKLTLGGGWETFDVGRDLSTGLPRPASDPKAPVTVLDGLVRLRQTWSLDQVDLWVGGGALGHGNLGFGTPASGPLVDQRGNLLGFVQAGATQDHRQTNAHGVTSGTFAEALVEAGPALAAIRGTDYYKVTLATSAFVPLWDLDAPNQLFSGVLALRANAQWIDGTAVPLLLLEPTEVRGYHRVLESRFRSVATGELRVGLPSLWGVSDLVPVVIAFAEGGRYAGFTDAPASESDQAGWLASAGGGLGLAVFGAATPTLTVALPLVDESALWWKVNFNLRF